MVNTFINKDNSIIKLKYFISFFDKILSKFIIGYVILKNRINIIVPSAKLFYLLLIMKKNIVSKIDSLLDISVVDYPTRKNRFELNYVFLNYSSHSRIVIKINYHPLTVLPSISSLYSSSEWLEREA